MMRSFFIKLLVVFLALGVLAGGAGFYLFTRIQASLPQLITVQDYKPLLVTKVFDRNKKLIGEFYRERRVLVPYKQMPQHLIQAFLAAEDDQFFEHKGVNVIAILRATLANLQAGQTVQGGSTITQQVAKTLLLSSEKTYIRKIKEAMLATQMEKHLSKEDILYLYLNQIFFGAHSYGVQMASETYFRKSVKEVSIAEAAILAGLPKAPSAFSPVVNPTRAKERQLYVLRRMRELNFINEEQFKAASVEPLKIYSKPSFMGDAPFFLETVRLLLVEQLGEKAVLDEGLRVFTSLDLKQQRAAQAGVEKTLKELDKRQGFRGAKENITDPKEVGEFLLKSRNQLILSQAPFRVMGPDGRFPDLGNLNLEFEISEKNLPKYLPPNTIAKGIVSFVDDEKGLVYVRVAEVQGLIDFDTMKWARKPDPNQKAELSLIKKPSEALKMGDVIQVKVVGYPFKSERLEKLIAKAKKDKKPIEMNLKPYLQLELDQEPTAEAALIAFDLKTQDVLTLIGGYDFERSEYNRALQAARQTGSAFKSLVYAAALDRGYTPSTPIMDAPIVYEQTQEDSEGQEDTKVWKPSNHGKDYAGDIIFRNALVRSLNIPTVKIIEDIGVPYSLDYARRLGVHSPLNPDFTLALGSSSVTLYELTKVFAQFGRMGQRIRPVIVHKVEDSNGKTLTEALNLDLRISKEVSEMEKEFEDRRTQYLALEQKPETKGIESHMFFSDPEQLMKPTTAYLITSLLKGVIEDRAGTGGRARSLGRDVAGKTGTTNGYFDAWFIGYTPQIAAGAWVGFDQEKSLGKGEVGGRSALPIWLDYMKVAHEELPVTSFEVPPGIVFANIDSETGLLASGASRQVIRQAFLEGTEPKSSKNEKQEETDFFKQDAGE